MKHISQTTNFSCGAACVAMIAGIGELDAMRICKTKKSGTNTQNAVEALEFCGFEVFLIKLKNKLSITDSGAWWLKELSMKYPVYVSGNFISNSGRGRNSHRHHAFVVADGKVFDPALKFELDFEAHTVTFNRDLLIKSFILVNRERPNYGKNNI